MKGVLRPGHGIEFHGVTRVNFRTQAGIVSQGRRTEFRESSVLAVREEGHATGMCRVRRSIITLAIVLESGEKIRARGFQLPRTEKKSRFRYWCLRRLERGDRGGGD